MASRGAKLGVSTSIATRAERLVRALTGVLDVRVDVAPNGRITGVYVVPETGFSPQRVVQNVRSGLMAATGTVLEPGRIFVVRTLPGTDTQNGSVAPVTRDDIANLAAVFDTGPAGPDEAAIDRAPRRSAEPPVADDAGDLLAPAPAHDLLAPAPDSDARAPDSDARAPAPDSLGPAPDSLAPAPDSLAPAPDSLAPAPDSFAATPDSFAPAARPPVAQPRAADSPQAIVPSRPDPVAPLGPESAPHRNGKNGSQPHETPAQPAWPVFNHYSAMPRIELLEMQRDETGAPRCRIIIESDGRRFLGTATNTRGSETTADLIAAAIVHGLESLIPCDLHFDGMADVIIAGQRHVVVSLRNTSDWSHALSGAAPVHDSVEHAIANAILNAIGIGIAHSYSFMNRFVNHR